MGCLKVQLWDHFYLLYTYDLQHSLKFATTSHFAEDTCLIYASKNPKTLETNLNYDLKNLNLWLCANTNVDKTKHLLFHTKYNKKQYGINIKMQGVRLEHLRSVKYLGVYLDDNLSWGIHIRELSNKLGRANGIMSKLRHYVPKTTVLQIYYALFYSRMSYGSLVWSLTTQKNLDIIFILQKKCIRILNSVSYNGHTNPLFVENKIVKFPDITKNQLVFVHQLINNILPHDLNCLFTYTTDIHSHYTQIFIPQISSTNFGNYPLKFKVPCLE